LTERVKWSSQFCKDSWKLDRRESMGVLLILKFQKVERICCSDQYTKDIIAP